jgi:hypothetical protein
VLPTIAYWTDWMNTITDCFGRHVRLTAERLAHILEHPEMNGLVGDILHVVQEPELVKRSRSDATVELFYTFCASTVLGGKWLCVVVKYDRDDAFVVTAYLTAQPKTGDDLWPTK